MPRSVSPTSAWATLMSHTGSLHDLRSSVSPVLLNALPKLIPPLGPLLTDLAGVFPLFFDVASLSYKMNSKFFEF